MEEELPRPAGLVALTLTRYGAYGSRPSMERKDIILYTILSIITDLLLLEY